MKISVSIPDELWSETAGADGQSPSQIVQEALRTLISHRRASEERVADFESRLESRSSPGGDEPGSGWSAPLLRKLTDDALKLYDAGYRMAADVAGDLSWVTLEHLPSGPRLREVLLQWASGDDPDFEMGDRIHQALSEWDQCLDENDDPIPSQMLYQGMAAGLEDVRSAVRERVRRNAETAEGS